MTSQKREDPRNMNQAQHLTLLYPKGVPRDSIEANLFKYAAFGETDRVNQTNQIKYGMREWVWKEQVGTPFINTAKSLTAAESSDILPVWLSHVPAGYSHSLHEKNFVVQVSECSLGCLVNPFTFNVHMNWKELECSGIEAQFDFDKELLRVVLELDNLETVKLEVSFSELKKAFIVVPKNEDGDIFYSVCIYLKSVPKLWKAKYRRIKEFETPVLFTRVTKIPGSEELHVGKCSALKLDLLNVAEEKLLTLLDKLDTCEFNLWWAPIKENVINQDFVADENEPWSIQWLISLGYRVSDQLSSDNMNLLREHENILYYALQGALAEEIIVDVMAEFQTFLCENEASGERGISPELPSNFTLIPKLVVTPTRLIFLPPEPVQMNRVTREYDAKNFITVSFKDENQNPLSPTFAEALTEPVNRIKTFLRNGLNVEGRRYEFLGCSNSQLRQHGCWMYARPRDSEVRIEDIKDWMGDLAGIHCVALYLSRLGQFFSSSTRTVDLSSDRYTIKEIPDVERNGYCFTDGVGKISADIAEEIVRKHHLEKPCSAFQIRLGGCKGVLVVDQTLPEGEILIRPSMKKFHSTHAVLEVVDYSRPHVAYLNRQIITLMSQRGVSDDVFFTLLEWYQHYLLDMFTSNERAFDELSDAFRFLNMAVPRMDVISDPFFRSLLLARYEERLNELLERTRILLPFDKGRVLMGVADETGKLSSGQVFIQYSKHLDNSSNETTIVEGNVMVAKSPTLHPGDLRVFQAVDCPSLHHIVDCIVFPIHGDRPHCDEISGSDLDGDLYWTTWHPDLILKDNCEAMQFPKVGKKKLDHTPTQKELIEYIGDFIKNSDAGYISSAHLVHADSEKDGIFSEKCKKLAWLLSVSLDFQKTGEPSYMSRKLRPTRYPDFMMKKTKDHYVSKGILGKLYRYISQLSLSERQHAEDVRDVAIFSSRVIDQIERELKKFGNTAMYQDQAGTYYDGYAEKLQNILNKYGVRCESDAFACSIYRVKQNSLMKVERHELTLLLKAEIAKLRRDYLEVFERNDTDVDRIAKALIWYRLAYQRGKYKSFAWIATSAIESVMKDSSFANDASICHTTEGLFGTNRLVFHDLDHESGSLLPIQKTVGNLFVEEIRRSLPDLQCSLKPIDLTKWNIESIDIYIQLKHSDDNILQKEFGEIYLTMPNLDIIRTNRPGHQGCHITERGLEQVLIFEERQFTIHVYHSGILAEILEDTLSVMKSTPLRNCLQILSYFWVVFANHTLQDTFTVLHFSDMLLRVKDKKNDSFADILYQLFRYSTEFGNLLELKDSTPLWNVSTEVLRLFQLNLFEGLQLLVLSGSYEIPRHVRRRMRKERLRSSINLSTTGSSFLLDERVVVSKILAMRSGCQVEIGPTGSSQPLRYSVEGFGTKQALIRLSEEIHHLETIVGNLQKYYPMPRITGYRKLIFEESACDDDEIVVIPYKGRVYRKHHRKKMYTLFVRRCRPLRSVDEVEELNINKVINNYCEIIANARTNYDEQYFGDMRVIARLAFFHFRANNSLETVKQFTEALNADPPVMRTSSFPASVDIGDLRSVLEGEGLVPDEMPIYKYVVTVNIQDKTLEVNKDKDEHYTSIKVYLDENFQITELHYLPIRWGTVLYLRKSTRCPGRRLKNKMPDLFIHVQMMRNIDDVDNEHYSFITKSKEPVLMVNGEHSDMPLVEVHEKFRRRTTFIRQKKKTIYRYPLSEVARNLNHFTAHVQVEVSTVREYEFKRPTDDCQSATDDCCTSEYTEVTVVLPKVPPLHCEKDHQNILKNIMKLCLKIGNSIPCLT